MVWWKAIVLVLLGLLLVGLILYLLISCGLFQVMDGPGMEYHGEEDMPAEDSKPESVGDLDRGLAEPENAPVPYLANNCQAIDREREVPTHAENL